MIILTINHRFSSILAYTFYLLVAYTNPGYLLGSSEELAKRAGAYDAKNFGLSERKPD